MKRLYFNLGAPLPGHPRSADSIVKASGKKNQTRSGAMSEIQSWGGALPFEINLMFFGRGKRQGGQR